MAYRLTIRAKDMREINRSAIMERLDVSLPTMMSFADDLIEEVMFYHTAARNG